jgi:hypothetical protein
MDPNANYTEQQSLLATIQAGAADDEQVERYHELVSAYRAWVAGGGFRADADPGRPELSDFLAGYVECALFSTNDESNEQGGNPLDDNYTADDISDETLTRMAADCARFQTECADDLAAVDGDLAAMPRDGSSSDSMAGHLFWLTRNGHGTGYWDRDLGDAGERLTAACERFGEVYLSVGDDGTIDGN